MSAKAIREATGKGLLNQHLKTPWAAQALFASVNEQTNLDQLEQNHGWLLNQKVIKHLHIK